MLPRAVALTLAVLALAAGAAAFPIGASASVAPTLSLNEGAGDAAASTGALGFAISFHQSAGDAVSTASIILPLGLLINENLDNGTCLSAGAPLPACAIGAGDAVIAGVSTPMVLYLTAPPAAADAAGVELVAGSLSLAGGLSYVSSTTLGISPSQYVAQEISFTSIPPAPLDALQFVLDGLTLPSSCAPGLALLSASSQKASSPTRVTAPYAVYGCRALPYAPTTTMKVARDPGKAGGILTIEVATPTGDSASQTIKLGIPQNITLNPRMQPCLNGEPCTVGTITATSPVIPSSELTGTIMFSGTAASPALTITFPPPLGVVLNASVTYTHFNLFNLPDIPFSTLTMTFTGNQMGRMFIASCYPAAFSAILAPWSGSQANATNNIAGVTDCRRVVKSKPSAFASMAGLRTDAPKLSVKATRGRYSADIRSLSITPPPGVSFLAGALASGRGLSLSGARLRSARIQGGALVVTFKRSTARTTVKLGGPLLVESASLLTRANDGRARFLHLTVWVTDGDGTRTKRRLTAHAGS